MGCCGAIQVFFACFGGGRRQGHFSFLVVSSYTTSPQSTFDCMHPMNIWRRVLIFSPDLRFTMQVRTASAFWHSWLLALLSGMHPPCRRKRISGLGFCLQNSPHPRDSRSKLTNDPRPSYAMHLGKLFPWAFTDSSKTRRMRFEMEHLCQYAFDILPWPKYTPSPSLYYNYIVVYGLSHLN